MTDYRNYLFGLALLAILLAVTDCSSGHTVYRTGRIRQHLYQPAYASGSGKQTTHHPAELHLLIWVAEPEHELDIEVSLFNYLKYPDGSQVIVGEREGRWTNFRYLKWLSNKPVNSSY